MAGFLKGKSQGQCPQVWLYFPVGINSPCGRLSFA